MADRPAHTLTDHAVRMLAERGIDVAWVEAALDDPERTEPDDHDPDLLHRLVRVAAFGDRVLRVVATRDEPFFDRSLRHQPL